MIPNGASNFSQRGSAGMSRIDLLHLGFDSQVLVHRNDGHGKRRSSVVSHNGKWSTFYAGNRLWDTETLSRELLRRKHRCAYDPFFHARAMNRPILPESTWRAFARFRARASGESRREK